ncbi:recombinase family protein [Clostridium fungisolvens]|uniref:recombinase family protein n=1 Tax=Clostridium fungisolvens TaxID=1604897 RepID=UPI001FCED78C|nr:recombinase family protein [Clostridium fungisolvens]
MVNHNKFLGYDKDEEGNLIINEKQAKIVRRIYKDYLDGKGSNRIARELEEEGVKGWNGKAKWYESTIRGILTNEKYKEMHCFKKRVRWIFLLRKEWIVMVKFRSIMLKKAILQL